MYEHKCSGTCKWVITSRHFSYNAIFNYTFRKRIYNVCCIVAHVKLYLQIMHQENDMVWPGLDDVDLWTLTALIIALFLYWFQCYAVSVLIAIKFLLKLDNTRDSLLFMLPNFNDDLELDSLANESQFTRFDMKKKLDSWMLLCGMPFLLPFYSRNILKEFYALTSIHRFSDAIYIRFGFA